MLTIIHHDDPDGQAAAAAYWHLKGKPACKFIEVNYEKTIDVSALSDEVAVLDFSLPPEEMAKLNKLTDLTWIDHHKTAIDANDTSYKGLRDDRIAACVLVWRFFGKQPPRAVVLIGDRDTWDWQFGKDTKMFTAALRTLDTRPQSKLWDSLFSDGMDQNRINNLYAKIGEVITSYRGKFMWDYIKQVGYESELAWHKVLAINISSQGTDDLHPEWLDRYDIVAHFVISRGKIRTSLYSKRLDVGQIATALGGGGHKGAAGFVSDTLPFRFIKGIQ